MDGSVDLKHTSSLEVDVFEIVGTEIYRIQFPLYYLPVALKFSRLFKIFKSSTRVKS